VSGFAELMAMVTFIYPSVVLCFIQIYLVFIWGNLARIKKKYICLLMINNCLESFKYLYSLSLI